MDRDIDHRDIDHLIAITADHLIISRARRLGGLSSPERLTWAREVQAGGHSGRIQGIQGTIDIQDLAAEIIRRAETPGVCTETGEADTPPEPDADDEVSWPRDAALIVEFCATVSMAATWLAGQVNAADPRAATLRRNVIRHAGEHRVRTEPTKAEKRRRRIALAWTQPLAVQS